jgi:rod shape determining protein RodA
MFERRLYFHIDWLLLAAVLLLTAVGLSMIYSTTYVTLPDGTGHSGPRFWVQLYAVGLGVMALAIFLAIDYRFLAEHSLFLYVGLLLLLIYVLVGGVRAGGSQRWISLGHFNLQPSEFGRLALALILAMYFAENRRGARNYGDLVVAGLFFLVPFLLIAKQPDLGTAVTLVPVCFGIAYLAGLRLRLVAIVAIVAVLLAPLAWKVALKDYQKSRIETFLDPEKDPLHTGYQQIQARISVGSGGLKGKGFMKGTQGQYKFLPVA